MITQEEYKRKTSKARRLFHKHVLVALKSVEGCKRCGASEDLTFHHLDRSQKRFILGRKLAYDLPTLLTEADKCIVLCTGCHEELERKENLRLASLTKEQKKEVRERKCMFYKHPWMWMDA